MQDQCISERLECFLVFSVVTERMATNERIRRQETDLTSFGVLSWCQHTATDWPYICVWMGRDGGNNCGKTSSKGVKSNWSRGETQMIDAEMCVSVGDETEASAWLAGWFGERFSFQMLQSLCYICIFQMCSQFVLVLGDVQRSETIKTNLY